MVIEWCKPYLNPTIMDAIKIYQWKFIDYPSYTELTRLILVVGSEFM